MNMKESKKLLTYLAAAYWVLAIMIYVIAGNEFRYTYVVSDALSAGMTIGEVTDDMQICQTVTVPADLLSEISLMTATYGRSNQGTMVLTFRDMQEELLAQKEVDISAFADNKYTTISLDEPIAGHKGEKLNLTIETVGCVPGNTLAIYAGNTVTTGRFDIVRNIEESDRYRINGQSGEGMLCVKLGGTDELSFYKTYWLIVSGLFAVIGIFSFRSWQMAKKDNNNLLVVICLMCTRYTFLIKQLVGRDFKAKYKRSVLGVAWSFLNPLLTMFVQYLVFSTLFRNDISNYPVYLLTGTVFFNFFNEAVGTGMTSITGSAHLIKKVYMPRYIYPVAKVMSSLVNFGFAFIPLLLMILFTGLPIGPQLLLLVFDVLCMLGFVMGMVLILSVCMTFFQDTQFLWGVVSMLWMYMTPIFYPESIIPQKLLTIYHINPMYQYITFARTVLINGHSPAPSSYLWCLLSAVVVLFIGIKVFNKYQDELVLHL